MQKLRSKIFFLAILFCGVFGLAKNSQAQTYYVANAGNNTCDGTAETIGLSGACAWKTIAKVNSYAFQPGDYILFNKGNIWLEQLTVPSSGSDGQPITFGAYGDGTDPIIDGGSSRQLGIYISDKSYVIVQDLILQNTGTNGQGLRINISPGNTVHDITIQRVSSNLNMWDGFMVQGGSTLPVTAIADNLQFIDCTADRNGRTGYYAYYINGDDTNGIQYRNCKATYSAQGMSSHGFSSTQVSYLKRYGCESSYTGIDPNSGQPNAYASSEGIGFAFDDVTNNSLNTNCYAYDNAGAGFQLSHNGNGNVTRYSLSVNNGKEGYAFNGGFDNHLYNSIAYGNGTRNVSGQTSGVDIYASLMDTTNSVVNSIIMNNAGYGLRGLYGTVSFPVADHNIIFGNAQGDYIYWTPTNNLASDALFASSSDFHLQKISPAINAGTDVGLTIDFDGNPIIGTPDIGAYEYQGDIVAPMAPGGLSVN